MRPLVWLFGLFGWRLHKIEDLVFDCQFCEFHMDSNDFEEFNKILEDHLEEHKE